MSRDDNTAKNGRGSSSSSDTSLLSSVHGIDDNSTLSEISLSKSVLALMGNESVAVVDKDRDLGVRASDSAVRRQRVAFSKDLAEEAINTSVASVMTADGSIDGALKELKLENDADLAKSESQLKISRSVSKMLTDSLTEVGDQPSIPYIPSHKSLQHLALDTDSGSVSEIEEDPQIVQNSQKIVTDALNDSLQETTDLLELLTNEERHRRKKMDRLFMVDDDSDSEINPAPTLSRPKSAHPHKKNSTAQLLRRTSSPNQNFGDCDFRTSLVPSNSKMSKNTRVTSPVQSNSDSTRRPPAGAPFVSQPALLRPDSREKITGNGRRRSRPASQVSVRSQNSSYLRVESKKDKRETGKENLTPRNLRFEVNDDSKKAGSTFPRNRPDSEKGKLVRGPKKKNLVSSSFPLFCQLVHPKSPKPRKSASAKAKQSLSKSSQNSTGSTGFKTDAAGSRPVSARSNISNSGSKAGSTLIKQTLSHPVKNKNFSFSEMRVKEIQRENMRLYKNLLKINAEQKEMAAAGRQPKSKPQHRQAATGDAGPIKATHRPKSGKVPKSEKSGDRSAARSKPTRPISAASMHSQSAFSVASNTSVRSNRSRTSIGSRGSTKNKSNTSMISNSGSIHNRPVPAAALNRERARERIERDNLRIYQRLQNIKPTLVTRFF